MITHVSIIHGLDCLTLVILPFTLTALIVGSRLCCALIEAFKLGILLCLCEKFEVSKAHEIVEICYKKSHTSQREK